MPKNTAINAECYQYQPYSDDEDLGKACWHVLWTRSNFEQQVKDKLVAKGYEIFLPMINQWTGEDGKFSRTRRIPMFRGYLFLRHKMCRRDYLEISNTYGVVTILGARWDSLAHIPDKEIEAIGIAVASKVPAMPHPYLEKGDKVRVVRGALKNAEGFLVETSPEKGLLVISVNLLNRSIAMVLDCAEVVPA